MLFTKQRRTNVAHTRATTGIRARRRSTIVVNRLQLKRGVGMRPCHEYILAE